MSNSENPKKQKEGWPMWPLAVSILVFIVIYSWINISYRKEGDSFEPAQAMRNRVMDARAKNIYNWYPVEAAKIENASADLSAEGIMLSQPKEDLSLIVPSELVYSRQEPKLISQLGRVESAPAIVQGQALPLILWLPSGMAADKRFHLTAFYKEGRLHAFAEFFADKPEEAAVFDGAPLQPAAFAIPTDPFDSPEVSISLYSQGKLHSWTLPCTVTQKMDTEETDAQSATHSQ